MTSSFTTAKISENDQRDAIRLAHTWYYWPLRIFSDAHGYGFLYVAIVGASAYLLYPKYRSRETLLGAAGGLGLAALLSLLTHLLRNLGRRRRLRRRNAEMETWAFNQDGLLFRYRGSLRVERWTAHRRAAISQRLLVLHMHKTSRKFRVLPISELKAAEREQLLALLREKLGPAKVKEASIHASRLRPHVIERA